MNARAISQRIRSNWELKVLLSIGLTIGFWALYLFIQRHPLFTVTQLNEGWLDQRIPFSPKTVYLYESLWLLMPIAPFLMVTKTGLYRYSGSLLFVSIIGFIFFLLFPTSCSRPSDITGSNWVYNTMVSIDKESNAFPSLHTAFAILSGAWCNAVFRLEKGLRCLRWGVWCWALGIIASTLLTKQHVVVDVIGGTIVGIAGYILFNRIRCWGKHRNQP